jgi:hypothetical protein
MKLLVLVLFSFVHLTILKGQEIMSPDTNALKTVGGIVKETLRLISSEKGKTKNWEALRNLFLPTATLTVLNNNDSVVQQVESVSLNEFIDLLHDEYYEQGYVEYETGKTFEEFNGIANVFQSFYGKDSEGLEERGMNSYQLVFYNKRWWIASLLWTLETSRVKIPEKYLSGQRKQGNLRKN